MPVQGAQYAGSGGGDTATSVKGGQYSGGGATVTIHDGIQLAGITGDLITPVAGRGVGYGAGHGSGETKPSGLNQFFDQSLNSGSQADVETLFGALYASDDSGIWSGTRGIGGESVGSLLDVEGYALVLQRGDGDRRAWRAGSPNQSLIDLSITTEVNTMSDWRATVPPDPSLYDWSFARASIAHDGQRLFHGIVLPVEAGHGDSMTVGGFGPLWHATQGDMEITYPDDHPDFAPGEDIPAWRAIANAWIQTANMTGSRVRGYAVPPSEENERVIPGSGETYEGTPLAILQELHSYAGMAFAIDHSDPAGIAVSFVPGEEPRAGQWNALDYSVNINPSDYANRVVVLGADAPDTYAYDRYRGVAEATQSEIAAVTNGRILEHVVRDSELDSERACGEAAKSKLAELRGNFSITGSVEAAPVNITPGYEYRVKEFDDAAPEPFEPVRMPLQSVSHELTLDDATTTLKFESVDGLAQAIRERLLGGTAISVARQNAQFGTTR